MFGQAPRSNSDFWKMVRANGIEDEEDFPTPFAESNDDLNINQDVNRINLDEDIDGEKITVVNQLSNDAASSSINSQLNSNASSSITVSTPTRHSTIRTIASNHYMASASKKMKLYEDSLKIMPNNYNVNDCVGIEIHSVDRTNTDPKYLPCVIVEKLEQNNIFSFKLICQYGVLTNTFEASQFLNLKDACPTELKNLDVANLKPITIIEASKLYSRGSTTGRTCNCRGTCGTKTCPCKKENVFCSTKCHSKRGGCLNME
ncbi:unnamed protein product [Rotaria sordida]|uniref:Uncharacterized protein n=1 Tax=Rotaria sordida TaxID=392033 RepID=A0A819RA22_9BILA|nr:unnamed protein product [Rotaria sordida]CAF1433621.1 unnamed protein product [Rotaria sordida]CAF1457809.1 unnamed protein product [Rotaria sordida]CAF4041054.1 unnamed protein product [Rotaria sordida]CAF4178270.1 unnamed protein product [Rotaria sordida]